MGIWTERWEKLGSGAEEKVFIFLSPYYCQRSSPDGGADPDFSQEQTEITENCSFRTSVTSVTSCEKFLFGFSYRSPGPDFSQEQTEVTENCSFQTSVASVGSCEEFRFGFFNRSPDPDFAQEQTEVTEIGFRFPPLLPLLPPVRDSCSVASEQAQARTFHRRKRR